MDHKRKVSVVIPFFNEEGVIELFSDRLTEAVSRQNYEFEFIVVDDGSQDATFSKLQAWYNCDPRVIIVKLSRNWGHQSAFNAGLDIASGQAIIFMDGDLEDPPELIPDLLAEWEAGYNTVYTKKVSRHQRGLRKFLTRVYYSLVKKTNKHGVPPGAGMFSLIDSQVANVLREMKESNKSYPNLRSFLGFKQKSIPYVRDPRAYGNPKQSLSRLLNDGLNAIFSNTFLPIRFFSLFGLFCLLIFVILGLTVFVVRITGWEFWIFRDIPGTQMILLAVLAFGSLQIMFLGILGEYIARIYDESKGRPYYVIEEIKRSGEA
jgi:polyisoprenyl-phosphate glycosyltransferase